MKRNLVIGVAALGIAALIASVVFRTPTYDTSAAAASGARFVHAVTGGKVNYFDGRAFKQFDLKNQSITELTAGYVLPAVSDIRWTTGRVAFQAAQAHPTDDLYPRLTAAGLPTDQPTWWTLDFATGALNLLGDTNALKTDVTVVTDVQWTEDGNTCYFTTEPTATDEATTTPTLYTATPNGNAPTTYRTIKTDIAATDLLWADGDTVAYKNDDGDTHDLVRLATGDGSTQTLAQGFTGPAVFNAAGTQALYRQVSADAAKDVDEQTFGDQHLDETTGELKLIKVADRSTSTAVTAFKGAYSWDATGTSWYVFGTDDKDAAISFYTDPEGKKHAFTVKAAKDAIVSEDGPTLVGISDGQMVLLDEPGNISVAAKKVPSYKNAVSLGAGDLSIDGITSLTRTGTTALQAAGLTDALEAYAIRNEVGSNAVKLTDIVVVPRDPNSESISSFVTFEVAFGTGASIPAQLEQVGLRRVRVTLEAANGKPAYDSGAFLPVTTQ